VIGTALGAKTGSCYAIIYVFRKTPFARAPPKVPFMTMYASIDTSKSCCDPAPICYQTRFTEENAEGEAQ